MPPVTDPDGDSQDALPPGERDARRALHERIKELNALRQAAALFLEGGPIERRLADFVTLLPPAMQFPEIATACLRYREQVFATPGHRPTPWVLQRHRESSDGGITIEVAYMEARGDPASGPFLDEERELLGAMSDILCTAIGRSRKEAELRELNERMELALTSAGMGIWELDVASETTRWSPQLSAMSGLADAHSGPFKGREEVVHPEDRKYVFERIQRAIEGTEALGELEFRMRHVDGGWRQIAARGVAIRRSGQTRAERVIAALVDVTEKRRYEEELRQAERVEALGLVAAGVAHDFNNVLTVVIGGAGLLMELLPEGETRELAREIRGAGERGVALARQLLSFARRTPFNPTHCDVNETIDRLHPLLARIVSAPVELAVDLDPAIGPVGCDASQLEQLVLNLVVNGRDAVEGAGRVSLTTRRSETNGSAARAFCTIEVRDTGVGMNEETRARIFEPFFTTKDPSRGTGLGLALVARIVRQWRGRIEVDSCPGAGSTFRVSLPIDQE